MNDEIVTLFDGVLVDIANLTQKFCWEHRRKIFSRMAKLCRWGGEPTEFYSVAEHSCLVAGILKENGVPPLGQLHGLLHDAHEAFTGDVITPIVEKFPNFVLLKNSIDRVLLPALGVKAPIVFRDAVKEADRIAKHLESRHFEFPMDYPRPHVILPIDCMSWQTADEDIVGRYDQLYKYVREAACV